MNLPFYEFFAGGGMARVGLGVGWACAFANDDSETKARSYRANFKPAHELKVCDVARLTTADLPGRADLAWASSPCMGASLAGGRKGLGTEAWAFLTLMQNLRAEGRAPRLVVIENVPAMLDVARREGLRQGLRHARRRRLLLWRGDNRRGAVCATVARASVRRRDRQDPAHPRRARH